MLKFRFLNLRIFKAISICYLIFCAAIFADAQSNDQNFPTPITTNELSGTIKARDIGDSRLTTYYFTFDGNQGDIFINAVIINLNGDLDIFTVEGLRPLTKIVVYADSSDNETGRVIYLRKPEKILLRIQGRSPNDDPATFQIKFAGSFLPSSYVAETEAPKLPEVTRENNRDVIVNSVGTIIGVKPKPTPEPKETVAEKNVKKAKSKKEETEIKSETETQIDNEKASAEKSAEQTEEPTTERKPLVIINDDVKKEEEKEETTETENTTENNLKEEVKKEKVEKVKTKKADRTTKKTIEPSLLENIRLVVLLKDGGKIERPMSEVVKFGVEKGILTIISKDGSISRYSILDVEKVTIE